MSSAYLRISEHVMNMCFARSSQLQTAPGRNPPRNHRRSEVQEKTSKNEIFKHSNISVNAPELIGRLSA